MVLKPKSKWKIANLFGTNSLANIVFRLKVQQLISVCCRSDRIDSVADISSSDDSNRVSCGSICTAIHRLTAPNKWESEMACAHPSTEASEAEGWTQSNIIACLVRSYHTWFLLQVMLVIVILIISHLLWYGGWGLWVGVLVSAFDLKMCS